jgi:large subunit ribosomal protein L9
MQIQIILMERVHNLGELGDVVKVKPGYARNYLIPQGRAKRMTPENMAEFEAHRAELEKIQAEKLAGAREIAAAIDGMAFDVTRKAGVDGRLFGSVTHLDIADLLAAKGYAVEKGAIRMPTGPLKQVGEYAIEIGLHSDAIATIHVRVAGES